MTTYPAERPVALAVKALLEAELGAGKVGYGTKPSAGGWQTSGTPTSTTPFAGYAVLWVGQTTPGEGTAADPSQDGRQGWQVSSFGSSAEQADAIRDRCRAVLLGSRLVLAGRAVSLSELSDSVNVTRDDDVTPPVYMAADRFTVNTYPA